MRPFSGPRPRSHGVVFSEYSMLFCVCCLIYNGCCCRRKKLIGGGMGGEGGDGKPPTSIPTLVYLLPVLGFVGVGFAILAYCAFGT